MAVVNQEDYVIHLLHWTDNVQSTTNKQLVERLGHLKTISHCHLSSIANQARCSLNMEYNKVGASHTGHRDVFTTSDEIHLTLT
jgi:hypothetical protein